MQKIEKIIAQAMEFIHDYCFAIRDGSFEYFHESIVTQERIVFFRNHASVAFDKEIIIIIAKVLYKEGFAGFRLPYNIIHLLISRSFLVCEGLCIIMVSII